MANKDLQESVLVVDRSVIDPLCTGVFTRGAAKIKAATLSKCHFLERNIAEHDFTHKQVIPYVVIRHQDRYLLIQRTSKQTEKRLHNLYSLGVGGHINDEDVFRQYGDVITAGMRRELTEEFQVEAEESCELVGVINDDSTEVARVHMGLVYVLTTGSPDFRVVEVDKHTASWKTVEEMADYYEGMESWAKIVHDFVVCAGSEEREKRWAVTA